MLKNVHFHRKPKNYIINMGWVDLKRKLICIYCSYWSYQESIGVSLSPRLLALIPALALPRAFWDHIGLSIASAYWKPSRKWKTTIDDNCRRLRWIFKCLTRLDRCYGCSFFFSLVTYFFFFFELISTGNVLQDSIENTKHERKCDLHKLRHTYRTPIFQCDAL